MTSLLQNEAELNAINDKVLDLLRTQDEGMPPGQVVETVSADSDVSKRVVQEALRILLERGDLSFGNKLRIFISQV